MGVCDLKGLCAWGLCCFDGRLHRLSRSAIDGSVSFEKPPPDGMPDGHATWVIDRRIARAFASALSGTTITCTVDAYGALSFRFDDGPEHIVPGFQFPLDAPLRRWAFIPDKEDRVVIAD